MNFIPTDLDIRKKNRYLQPYVFEEYIVMQYLRYSKQNFED